MTEKADKPMKLDWFSVRGFKSHRTGSRVDLRGLTVLAGANSSGKSSVVQPLLLLKQTLHENRYDPGPLKLDGPNVLFTDTAQFFSQPHDHDGLDPLEVIVGLGQDTLRLEYRARPDGVDLVATVLRFGQGRELTLTEGATVSIEEISRATGHPMYWPESTARVTRQGIMHRVFISAAMQTSVPPGVLATYAMTFSVDTGLSQTLIEMIHLGGHRGNPSRRYPRSVSSPDAAFGLFHEQTAGVIARWAQHDPASLERLQVAMRAVGLGWSIAPVDLDATAIDLRIGRTHETSRNAKDLVSIADVGFGVSQSIPVLVALIDAKPGQLVYIEQPEIHLHPRAQIGVADLIVEASKRGARVVIETHSEIILTRIQYHVAKGTLPATDVLVHWFACDPKTGDTTVTAVEPDASGAFGDWPVDFAEVGEQVDREYVEAAWKRQSGEEG